MPDYKIPSSTPSTSLDAAQTFAALPPVWPEDLFPALRATAAQTPRTLIVFDDDPTGTQTVHDVPVITTWDTATLTTELRAAPTCLFILTNSRALPSPATRALHLEIAQNLRAASTASSRALTILSRSDSTLRGHFPLETDTLAEALGPFDATLIIPYFEAGGRYTLNDIHYVSEKGLLIPAAETPFARDAAFGYKNSHLPSWVAEKTHNRIPASSVATISLDLIRTGGPTAITAHLLSLPRGVTIIANAAVPADAAVLAAATLAAESQGHRFLYRTAASFVAARLGQTQQPLLTAAQLSRAVPHGGLTLVGSYVPKTTAQLDALFAAVPDLARIELNVDALLSPSARPAALAVAISSANSALASGRDTVVFTSRQLITGSDATTSLDIGRQVSAALIALVRGLTVPPRYLIAKGGITSSDTATAGLGVRRALVVGQALPGVPVWRCGPETTQPGLAYVVFPGNVGSDTALADLVTRLK